MRPFFFFVHLDELGLGDHSEDPTTLSHRCHLMREAAEQLRQSVDEAKDQYLMLRTEVSALEDQRTALLHEVAQLRATAQALPQPLTPHVAPPPSVSSRRTGVRARGERETGSDDESVQAANKEVDEEEHVQVGESTRKGRSRPASMIGSGSRQGSASITSGGGSVAGTTRSGRPTTRRLGKNVVYSRSQSQGASKYQPREVYARSRVPQLEADIKICKDGLLSETLLSSKTVLTEEQFEKVQKAKKGENEEEGEEEKEEEVVWSLACSFNVRMVPPPSKN